MSEQWAWEPVPDGAAFAAQGGTLLVQGAQMQMYHEGGVEVCDLPDDLRLCRRVPASAGVPVEALNRITAWVADWCNGNDDGFDDLAADVIDVRTWLRSLAPAQGQEGE